MRIRTLVSLGTLSTAALAAAACSGSDREHDPSARAAAALTVCTTNRAVWITPVPGAPVPCPHLSTATGTWYGKPLFSGAPPALAAYCAYDWSSPGGAPPDIGGLFQSRPGSELDCPVVAPLAPGEPSAIWKPLRKSFHTQASRSALKSAPSRTRVAVIDTAAHMYDSPSPDRSGHGRAVGRAIADLACPIDLKGSACVAEIRNHLALRRTTALKVDDADGGYFGTRSELAEAVYGAIIAWQKDYFSNSTQAERLVINLSVGWVPEHGGESPKKMPLAARSVYDALRFARCTGAAPIAAAGNYSAETSTGPMLPAGWEREPAPDDEACVDFATAIPGDLPVFGDDDAKLYRPLVYAVGALDAHDRPLRTMRTGGQPRLAAHGQAVVTTDPRATHTQILSGSSMSAAVGSGAAAAAWAYAPKLTATELMGVVYDKAETLDTGPGGADVVPEFCLGSSGCAAHPLKRVAVCSAVGAAACIGPFGCSAGPSCKPVPAHAGAAPALPPDWSSVYSGMVVYPPWVTAIPCSPGTCGDEHLPTQVTEPSVGPQPVPPCGACGLHVPSAYLWLSFDAPVSRQIDRMVVTAYYGRTIERFVVPKPDGYSYYPQRFGLIVPVHSGLTSAILDMVYPDGSVSLDARVSIPIYY